MARRLHGERIMKRPRHVPIACVLAALGLVAGLSAAAVGALWPREPDPSGAIAKARARVAAIRDARADSVHGTERIRVLAGSLRAGLGVDTPRELEGDLARFDTATGADVDRALADMDVTLAALSGRSGPPTWLDRLWLAALLAFLLATVEFLLGHRILTTEHRRIAALVGAAGRGRDLADAVKEALYAERLKAAGVEATARRDPGRGVRQGLLSDRSHRLDSELPASNRDRATGTRAPLPVLHVPEIVFDPPAPAPES